MCGICIPAQRLCFLPDFNILSIATLTSLLFNFRGVGNSQGSFDNGNGEVTDIISAYNYLTTIPNINPDKIGVAGYSFGASTTFNLFLQIFLNTALINPVIFLLKIFLLNSTQEFTAAYEGTSLSITDS